MTAPTYTHKTVNDLAVVDQYGGRVTELVLADGESCWNPASTKGHLWGPSTLVFDMHVSGIQIYEFDLGKCVKPMPGGSGCTATALPGTTRCADHPR